MSTCQENSDRGRIVQIENTSLWCWIDAEGVLKGTANEQPEDTDSWETMRWTDANLIAVKETDSPGTTLKRLMERETDALPVIDEKHQLVGVVTHRSAIKALSSTIEEQTASTIEEQAV